MNHLLEIFIFILKINNYSLKLCMIYEIIFWKKNTFEILWYVDYAHVQWKIMIYYDTKCLIQNQIYALSLTMFQWASPMGIIHWYSVDPASGGCALVFVDPASGGCALVFVDPANGGCALVFCGPRQWGLNVDHSQGYWVTSVLYRIGFMIILYVNIWNYWICIKSAWNIFLCLFVALFLKII